MRRSFPLSSALRLRLGSLSPEQRQHAGACAVLLARSDVAGWLGELLVFGLIHVGASKSTGSPPPEDRARGPWCLGSDTISRARPGRGGARVCPQSHGSLSPSSRPPLPTKSASSGHRHGATGTKSGTCSTPGSAPIRASLLGISKGLRVPSPVTSTRPKRRPPHARRCVSVEAAEEGHESVSHRSQVVPQRPGLRREGEADKPGGGALPRGPCEAPWAQGES